MRVEITQEDIDQGVPKSPCRCPVGRALNRCRKNKQRTAGVTHYTATLDGCGYLLPPDVSNRIRAFDGGRGMVPFAFELPEKEDFRY